MPDYNKNSEKMYKALEQAAYRAEYGAEATDDELDKFMDRGKTALAIAQISKQDLDEKIHGRAIEMTDAWEEERFKQKAAKKGLTEDEYREKIAKRDARWAKLPIINILYFLPKGIATIPDSLRRTIELGKNSKKARKEGFSEEEQQSLAERVNMAHEDKAASEDSDVENLSERGKDSDEYKAIRDFTAAVATAGEGDEASSIIEEAKKKALEQLAKSKNGAAIVDLEKIEQDLRGALAGQSKKSQEQVLKAVDTYLEKHVSIVSADVKTGLAAKEVYDKLKDRATVEHGIFAGVTVGLGASLVGLVRSKAVQSVAGPGLVQHGLKVGVAGVFGAVRAGAAEKKRQRKANIEAAVNNDGNNIDAAKDKKGREHTFEIIGSSELTKKIIETAEKINKLDDAGKLVEENAGLSEYYEAASLIAKIRARNSLQNQHHVQLIGYDGRESIEKSKLEMFKAISELKKAMAKIDRSKFDERLARHMEDDIREDVTNFEEHFVSIQKLQKRERTSAAVRGGLTAALTAAAIDQLLHHDAISKDFKDLKQTIMNSDQYKQLAETIRKPFAVPVAASSETATADITTPTRPEELNPIASEVGTNHENYEQYYHTPVIIEKDPDGSGWVVALDADGDGAITDADKIISGSLESDGVAGIDLTNEENIKALNAELADYKIELQHEAITVSRYGETSISDYLDHAENSVDNSGGVDWSRNMVDRAVIGDPIVVSADGMDSYEIPIVGINGGFPDGAKLLIDFDGDNGPGKALEYTIENGKAIVPADIVDTSMVGNGGAAQIIGVARVGEIVDGNKMISYVTKFGKSASLSDMISVSDETSGFAFTAVDLANNGERLSQFAVDANNELFGNMSEVFNGIETTNYDHLPTTIKVNDIGDGQSDLVLASGETIKDFDVQGGYHAEYDAFENVPFKADGSDTYLGTPIIWDADGDGAMNAAEEVSYVRQMFVRTATNPYMLGQNASNYGILEPSRLANLGISEGTLVKWGIADGVIDSEEDLNVFLRQLKLPENANLWDKVANETINEMETQLQGAEFEVETVSSRLSTFANSDRTIDTAGASTPRTAIYAYRVGESGEKSYIGNQGWWCRKYGGDAANLKVGDMPRCEQKCIIQGSAPITPPAPVTPVEPPVNPPTPTPTPTPTPVPTLDPKNIEAEIENAGDNVVPEYVATPAAPLSESPYEVNADNIIEHTVSTEESAANAAKAAADAIAAAEAAAEGDKIVEAVEQASSQEEIDNIGADLWRQFQGGQ